jgi:hypothetical protein
MDSGLFGDSTAGGDPVGCDALGAVWADRGPAVASSATWEGLWSCGIGQEIAKGSPIAWDENNPNVPELKIERKHFSKFPPSVFISMLG